MVHHWLAKPSRPLMPRSVYFPLRHMSNSPCAQAPHGTGSGRRTTPAMRSPGAKPLAGGACSTRPSDSWPSTRWSLPGGALPCSPATISLSVPQTPIATPRTRSQPSSGTGEGISVNRALCATRGVTTKACTQLSHHSMPFNRARQVSASRMPSVRLRSGPPPEQVGRALAAGVGAHRVARPAADLLAGERLAGHGRERVQQLTNRGAGPGAEVDDLVAGGLAGRQHAL